MADWQAFATAFLTDTAGYINERKDKAAEYEDKLREDAERNRERVQRKQMMMGSAQSIAKGLLELGATEELIRSAAASGPTGLTDLNRAFQEASTRFGPNFVKENPEIVNEIARTSATPEELGLAGESKTTLDEFMRSTYGLAAPTPDSYKAEETNLFGRLMGYGAKDQARQRLDSEIAYDGYSYLDLQEAARSAEYTSLVPGASVQYGAPKVFSSEAMVDESQEYQRIIRSLEATDEYSTLSARAKIAKDKVDEITAYGGMATTEDLATLAAAKDELQRASTQMQTLRANAMRDLVTQRSGAFFGDTYLDVMGDTIDRTVGSPAFSTTLRETTREQEEDMSRPMDDSMAPPADEATGVTTPEVRTDVLPEQKTYSDPTVLGGSPVAITLDEAGNETIRLTQPLRHSDGTVYPVGTTLPSEDAAPLIEKLRGAEQVAEAVAQREGPTAPTFQSSLEIKATADPDTFYEVYLPHFASGNRTYRVRGSDLKYIPDARLAAEQSTVIINGVAEEGSDLRTISGKRLQRKYGEYQEPVSTDPTAQAVETSERPTERPEGAAEDFYEQLDATTEVDAMTDSLLKSSGTDMLGYLKEKGLTKDADAASMLSALGEWADTNNKILPFNKESLLYAMRFGLNL